MTTIATDGRTIAADGRSCISDRVSGSHVSKLRRLKDGSILGLAGDLQDIDQVAAWLDSGEEGKKPKVGNYTDALRLMPDGRLLHYSPALLATPVDVPFAIGSGADFAIGAMDAGMSALRAVEIASQRDPFTGGKITTMEARRA